MIFYDIININLTAVSNDEVIENVPCNSCTLCCELLSPYLTKEEISSGKYPLSMIYPEPEQVKQNSEIGPILKMYQKKSGGCGLFIDGRCSIYEDRPIACRQFDCRKNHHSKVPNMLDNKVL